MASKRYTQMCTELGRLRRAFLPRGGKGTVLDLTPRLSLRALAFRLLSHAEIEHYLEDRGAEIAMAVDNAWKIRRHVSEATLCLLAFSGRQLDKIPKTLRPPPNKKQSDWYSLIKPDDRISSSISEYIRQARIDNHGIKEKNLLSLLLPLGVLADDIDEILLAELNDFGTKRGAAAHASVSRHVRAGVNPFDEDAQVRRIVSGLKDLDLILNKILERCA